MSWIDEGIAQQRRAADRKQLIAVGAKEIFEDLCREISERVAEAKQKGIAATCHETQGNETSYRIGLQAQAGQAIQPSVDVTLSRDKQSVQVTGGRTLSLNLEMCSDIVGSEKVCLVVDQPISVPDAVRLILEPFFFPQLSQQS